LVTGRVRKALPKARCRGLYLRTFWRGIFWAPTEAAKAASAFCP